MLELEIEPDCSGDRLKYLLAIQMLCVDDTQQKKFLDLELLSHVVDYFSLDVEAIGFEDGVYSTYEEYNNLDNPLTDLIDGVVRGCTSVAIDASHKGMYKARYSLERVDSNTLKLENNYTDKFGEAVTFKKEWKV